jgi:two-component system LytT family sensor kinase
MVRYSCHRNNGLSYFRVWGTGVTVDSLLIDYLFFSVISFCMWTGSAYAHYALRNPLSQIRKLYIRLPLRYSVTILVSWLISYVLLYIWNHYLQNDRHAYHDLLISQVIMTVISIQISSIYEIVYLNKERESDLVKVERSEKLKVQAQLDALKSQIDPHFIFNSLNTLSYLISQNQEKAKLFNDTLAKVYRYILLNKEKDLIQLKEEIEFASNYFIS